MFSSEQYRALREGSGLVDRSYRGRLRLSGQDRRDYLQGLLTNDIVALTAGRGCYASLLTAQGRMISDMYIVEIGESILMDLEPEVTEKVRAHLEQFVFSEDVQVVDESATLAQVGVFGPGSAEVVTRVLGDGMGQAPGDQIETLDLLENRIASWRGATVVIVRRDDLGVPGFDLLVERGKAGDVCDAIRRSGAVQIDEATAEISRVEAGRPLFHRDMDEDTIPLEAGIEERAISLTKGCYVGQEIIIRVLHRGHGRVARRLVGLTLDPSSTGPVRGDRIRAGARDVGAVTSAVWSPALHRPIAMAYVHRDFVEPSTAVDVVSGDSVLPATVTRLPFVAPPPFESAWRRAQHPPVETPER